jgi:hypothetical protein
MGGTEKQPMIGIEIYYDEIVDPLMESCKCGRVLVCSKCKDIPDRCKCEKEMLPEGYDYTLIEVDQTIK